MTIQILYDELQEDTMKYLQDNCELWDVIPGVGMFEKKFDSLSELYDFFNTIQRIECKNKDYVLSIIDKVIDTDEEMFLMIIKDREELI